MTVVFLKRVFRTAALLALMASAGSAFAHAHLEHSTPAADTAVAQAKELRLQFSEGVEQAFSKVELVRENTSLKVRSVATEKDDKKVLVVTPAAPLTPGLYTVKWSVVSVDTHKSQGQYTFTVSQ